MFAWICVLVVFVFGSRKLLGGVPAFGEFLRLPVSPRAMLTDYRSGWWGHGLGATTAVPTGVALTALASTITLFNMGLLHTIGVLGLVLVGYLGIWRLAGLFPTARARIAALVVYAAVPLPSQLLSIGRWGALACYAACPWVIHLLRRSAGLETFDRRRTARPGRQHTRGGRPGPVAHVVPAGIADGGRLRLCAFVRLPRSGDRRRPGTRYGGRRWAVAIGPDHVGDRGGCSGAGLHGQLAVGVVAVRAPRLGPHRRCAVTGSR